MVLKSSESILRRDRRGETRTRRRRWCEFSGRDWRESIYKPRRNEGPAGCWERGRERILHQKQWKEPPQGHCDVRLPASRTTRIHFCYCKPLHLQKLVMATLGMGVHGRPPSAPTGVGWRLARLLPALWAQGVMGCRERQPGWERAELPMGWGCGAGSSLSLRWTKTANHDGRSMGPGCDSAPHTPEWTHWPHTRSSEDTLSQHWKSTTLQ